MSGIRAIARILLPAPVRVSLRAFGRRVYHAGLSRFCPVCGSPLRCFVAFTYMGRIRDAAQCPVCGSLERQRLIWLYLRMKTNLFDGTPKKMLHIGPEACFIRQFRRARNLDYLSADLASPLAMEKMDITSIPYPDGAFDVILSSHVIQHIPDERKALSELFRVLAPGGWAILHENIRGDTTLQDPGATTPEERQRAYGDPTYCRRYGRDFAKRLEAHGFKVAVEDFGGGFAPAEITRLGFGPERDIYFCQKI